MRPQGALRSFGSDRNHTQYPVGSVCLVIVSGMKTPTQRIHTNRLRAFQFRCAEVVGHSIRCQHPSPAAVGDPQRCAA